MRIESVSDNVDGVPATWASRLRVEAMVQPRRSCRPTTCRCSSTTARWTATGSSATAAYADWSGSGPTAAKGSHAYVAEMPCLRSGMTGYTVRVLPRHGDIIDGRDWLRGLTWR